MMNNDAVMSQSAALRGATSPRPAAMMVVRYACVASLWLGASGWLLPALVQSASLKPWAPAISGIGLILGTALWMQWALPRWVSQVSGGGDPSQRLDREVLQAVAAAQVGAFEWDMVENRLVCSEWHERLWGLPKGGFGGDFGALVRGLHPEDVVAFNQAVQRCVESHRPFRRDFRVVWPDGSVHWIAMAGEIAFDERDGAARMRGTVSEVTEGVQRARLESLAGDVLGMISDSHALPGALRRILAAIKRETRLDAVAIRLKEGEDYPYVEAQGFEHGFLQAENSLLFQQPGGGLCRDENGTPLLECTCGLVISGRTDPANPLFTASGSAWTNHAARFLHVPRSEDPRCNPRNRCIHDGYQSVALLPIRAKDRIVGLLQLNDRRPDCFTPEMIGLLEGVAASIGVALLRLEEDDALRESEGHLRSLIDAVPEALFVLDPAGVILTVNPALAARLGKRVGECLGANLFSMLPEQVGERRRAWLEEAVRSRTAIVREDDRNGVSFRHHICPVADRNGQVRRVVVFAMDVTDRKRMERLMQERLALQDQLLKIVATVPGMIFSYRLSLDGRASMPYCTPLIEELWGLKPEEVREDFAPAFALLHPEDQPEVRKTIAASANAMTPWSRTFRVLHPRKGERWLEGRSVPQVEPDGCVLWHGFVQDVTERVRSEEVLRASEAQLNEAQSIGHLGGWERDHLTQALHWSDETFRILEIPKGDGTVPEDRFWATVHPEDRGFVRTAFARSLQTGEAYSVNHRLLMPDGRVKFVHERCRTQFREDGRPMRSVGIIQDLTQRRQEEDALREAEQLHTAVLQTAMDGFWRLSTEGRLLEVNETYCRMSGYDRAELLTMGVGDFEATESPEEVAGRIRSIIAAGHARFETRHRRKDGTAYDVEVSVQHKAVTGGQLFVFVRDVTERRKAEAALEHSHGLMQYVIAHARSAIAVHDRDLKYIYVSERYLQDYQLQEPEIIGKHHYEVFPDLPQKWRDVHQRALAGEVSSAEEDSYPRQDGSVQWTRWECRPWYESDGSIGGLIVYTEVITERVRAEQQLRKLSRAVEQSPASIVITDLTGAIEYVNPKFTHLTGYQMEEVRGRNPRILKGERTSPEVYRDLWEAITHGREWRGELHNRKKSGEAYWESVVISPIQDGQGNTTHFLAVKEDVTERKQLEAQLRQAQKLESIGQLAGGVAHDFNNIMAAIMLHLSLLQGNPNLDEEMKQALTDLMAEAQRAATLTRQLLMFSRRSVLEVRVMDLNEVLANLLKMLRRLIGEHISLRFEHQNSLPPIEGDVGMIEQVLLNLSVNARDAMPGGGRLTITTEAVTVDVARAAANPEARAGFFVCLSVADTGCGMDEVTLKHLFEPFYTTKGVGQGTGLGLATVHGIVAQHKGWIEVTTEPGAGTIFKVFLPATARQPAGLQESNPGTASGGRGTILVVEDEASVRWALARSLMRLGYTVIEARDGSDALARWRQDSPRIDLLFTDMVMPGGMSGLDLAATLRQEKPDLRVIISSGYSPEMSGRDDIRGEGILLIEKPYRIESLAKTVRECLEKA